MVVVGADVHKRSHTFVAVDAVGKQLGQLTVEATTKGHDQALAWACKLFPGEVVWAIEDCRHLSARLERDLLTAGQRVVRVPPKMMALVRASARTPGEVGPDRCVGGGQGVPAGTGPAGGVSRCGVAGVEAAGGSAGVVGGHQDSHDQQPVVAGP